jgi:hypothetical protein
VRRAFDAALQRELQAVIEVFGILIRQGCLRGQELHGLAEDKLTSIRQWADL